MAVRIGLCSDAQDIEIKGLADAMWTALFAIALAGFIGLSVAALIAGAEPARAER
jgi:hypothetical protein